MLYYSVMSKLAARPFDPSFDDARLAPRWALTHLDQVPPGAYPDGYVVRRQFTRRMDVFGAPMTFPTPLDIRLLYDPGGRLWMSDVPQERMMMFHNGQVSRGHILVGGLGLALYPQYAAHAATGFTVVERSAAVIRMVEPTLARALGRLSPPLPYTVVQADVAEFLAAPPTTRYDTVFLDTWDTLDAAHLPWVNRLRDLALRHLAPEGRVVLWGYRWMTRLFEAACLALLRVPPDRRAAWLAGQPPAAQSLLRPVVDQFPALPEPTPEALAWCLDYIVHRADGPYPDVQAQT